MIDKSKSGYSSSGISAFCSGLSKFKDDNFRSQIVKKFLHGLGKEVSGKAFMNVRENSVYHMPAKSFDDEPEGVFIVYDGT
jgi:hypothetical protein